MPVSTSKKKQELPVALMCCAYLDIFPTLCRKAAHQGEPEEIKSCGHACNGDAEQELLPALRHTFRFDFSQGNVL